MKTLIETINDHAIRCDYCKEYIGVGDGHVYIETIKKYFHPDCYQIWLEEAESENLITENI